MNKALVWLDSILASHGAASVNWTSVTFSRTVLTSPLGITQGRHRTLYSVLHSWPKGHCC